ncbi:GNAT family N-acetyltransferase [Roseovarius aestuarii]|nr:GNAT family N-acetyltransferase [Roseovarius aestuarii]
MRQAPQPARLRDVPRLTAILREFSRTTPWLPHTRSLTTDLALMARITRAGWVRMMRDARGAAGFIARDGGRIHALYVHPRARKSGLGRAMLREAQACCPSLDLWVAEANTHARAFYAAQGFAEIERGNGAGNDENLAEIRMVWSQREGATP